MDMSRMFAGVEAVLPDISRWDVSSVTNMESMFFLATSAEPDMSRWNFVNVTNMNVMFAGLTLPTEVYSGILNRIHATSKQTMFSWEQGIRNTTVKRRPRDKPCSIVDGSSLMGERNLKRLRV